MNITVVEHITPKNIDYPKVMISKSGRLVFFTERDQGYVIHDPNGHHKFGEASTAWDMSVFSPFYGTITIAP